MNIDGLSEETLEKFIDAGYIHEFADIFNLSRYQKEIVETPGFGQKSYDNLIEAVKKASATTLPRLIYGLGITGIGVANAKVLCRHFHYDFQAMRAAKEEELVEVDGIGAVLAEGWCSFFASEKNNKIVDHLLSELTIENEDIEDEEEQVFQGKNFVVTGSVEKFSNRKE